MYVKAKMSLLLAAFAGGVVSPALAQSLSSGFTGTGVIVATATNTGNMFDITVTDPAGITITNFDTHCNGVPGTPITVSIYTKPGSFVGFESNAAAWTLFGTTSAVSAGAGQPTPVSIGGLHIPANETYGIYVNIAEAGASVRYYTAAQVPAVNPSNAHMTLGINYGVAKQSLFGSTFTPRGWNGTVHYVVGQPQPAACCLPSGSCISALPNDCLSQGGVYNGPGSTCGSVTCPQPGACCLTDGTCSSLLESACLAGGGLWRGANSACASANCPTTTWMVVTPAPEARSRLAGAIVGNYFYYMAGESTGGLREITAWKLDLASHTWSPIATLPPVALGTGGVSNVDAAAIGTDIYLPGGYDGVAGVNRLAKYDTLTDTWEEVFSDPMPVAVYTHAAVALNGKLYVLGGTQVGTNLVYDPNASAGARWSTIPAPPNAHAYPAAAAIAGKIYVAGNGSAAVSTVDVYDPATNAWTTLANLTESRGGGAMYDVGGVPHAVSGGWASYLRSAERYTGSAWESVLGVNAGVRTLAYAGNSQYLVKAGGWNGGFTAVTEIMTLAPACYANCDGSTVPPILNVADFTCFLQKFAAGDAYANCDGSTVPPVLNVADFTCFLQKFAAGCN